MLETYVMFVKLQCFNFVGNMIFKNDTRQELLDQKP